MPTTCQLDGHPAQDWLASHVQLDNGRNDGFVESSSGPVAMGYWEQADQPFYYSLACGPAARLGQPGAITWPNRQVGSVFSLHARLHAGEGCLP